MDRVEFAALVEDARASHPSWFDLPADEFPGVREARRLQECLNGELPADYGWFLETYGGGDFAMARIYSADPQSDLYILECQVPRFGEYVAFSDNGRGDLYLFKKEGSVYVDRIHVWKHDTGDIRLLGEGGFLDFVARESRIFRA